jgi:cyanophycinase-like exopeptidase
MQISNLQKMTQALREKLRLVIAGRSGDPASDEPFLVACAAGFVVAEFLALR